MELVVRKDSKVKQALLECPDLPDSRGQLVQVVLWDNQEISVSQVDLGRLDREVLMDLKAHKVSLDSQGRSEIQGLQVLLGGLECLGSRETLDSVDLKVLLDAKVNVVHQVCSCCALLPVCP